MSAACTLAWCLTIIYQVPMGVVITPSDPAWKYDTRTVVLGFENEKSCGAARASRVHYRGRMTYYSDIGLMAAVDDAVCERGQP